MNISNFLKNRKSVREFKQEELGNDVLENVRREIKNLETESKKDGVTFKLYENGKKLQDSLKGKAGYAGVMINSPHYIVVERTDDSDDTILNSAYYTEKLITEVVGEDIGTCWVSLAGIDEETKKELFGADSKIIEYIIALGLERGKRLFEPEQTSDRKALSEIVFDGVIGKGISVEKLERRGLKDLFYFVGYAPSNKNLQPWRFLLKDDGIKLIVAYDEWKDSLLIDMGIVMYYFEAMAVKEGFKGGWEKVDKKEYEKDGIKYLDLFEYKL